MKEFTITLTKADAWDLLACIALAESESTAHYDSRFTEKLKDSVDTDKLRSKLNLILYGNSEGIYNET